MHKVLNRHYFIELLNQYFIFVLFGIVVLVLTLGYVLVVRDQIQQYQQSTYIELPQIRAAVDRLDAQKKALEIDEKNGLAFTSQERQLLGLMVPEEFDFSSITVQLSGLAQQYGFLVTKLEAVEDKRDTANTVNTKKVEDTVKKVKIKMSVSGKEYESFKQLVSAIEGSVMLFDTQSLTFSNSGASFDLELLGYFYPSSL
jgi:hypothetical protein